MSWCYNNKYPIVKIVGDQILDISFINAKTSEIQNLINTSAPPQAFIISPIIDKLNEVRSNFPNHQVTTYTYYPGYGRVTSITDPRGNTTYYNYDFGNFGRLLNVKDNDGNILSENEYHYKN
jgi:YD repeat-containing protein